MFASSERGSSADKEMHDGCVYCNMVRECPPYNYNLIFLLSCLLMSISRYYDYDKSSQAAIVAGMIPP